MTAHGAGGADQPRYSRLESTESGDLSVRVLDDPDTSEIGPEGPVRTVQAAELMVPANLLAAFWTSETLERLARSYWTYLRRRTLGLVRVRYDEPSRTVALLGRVPLLRFHAPRYETGDDFMRVTWSVDRGLLVEPRGRGRGHLRIEARRLERDGPDGRGVVRIDAEVANYYPLLRGSGRFARIGAWIYTQTQMRLHVWITRGFLRSLASGDLSPLQPGREPPHLRPDNPGA